MPARFRTKGKSCTCDDPCPIVFDEFSIDRLATAYTARRGSASVAGGVMTTTSSDLLLIRNTRASGSALQAFVSVKANAPGAKARIIGAYLDDDNYLYAEAKFSSTSGGLGTYDGWLKLFQRSGGVDTLLGHMRRTDVPQDWPAAAQLSICWNGTRAIANFGLNTNTSIDAPCTATGSRAGVGGDAQGGMLTFDSFNFSPTLVPYLDQTSSCRECYVRCGFCQNLTGTSIEYARVVLKNLGALNGTYVCDFDPNVSVVGTCIWRYDFPSPVDGVERMWFFLLSTTHYQLYLMESPTDDSFLSGVIHGGYGYELERVDPLLYLSCDSHPLVDVFRLDGLNTPSHDKIEASWPFA